MPQVVEATTIDEYMDGCPYLDCREEGHRWERMHKQWLTEGSGRERLWIKKTRCTGCGLLKIVTRDYQLSFLGRRYVYPDGYLVRGIVITRDDVCMWEIRQQQQADARRARRSKAS